MYAREKLKKCTWKPHNKVKKIELCRRRKEKLDYYAFAGDDSDEIPQGDLEIDGLSELSNIKAKG